MIKLFTVKDVAKNLGITPQAIYKQAEELQAKGFMSKNEFNDWEITTSGFNYLKDRQANRMKRQVNKLSEDTSINTDVSIDKKKNVGFETLQNFYEMRIKELKENYEAQLIEKVKQVDYFKNLYEEEREERKKTNAQYQTYLLGTSEDNKKQKAHWWQWK